jgi:Mg2+ and Co2+ transporter CorA
MIIASAILAETLPDPNSYAAIGWVCVILAALAFGINQVMELVNRARGKAPHPPNAQLEAAVEAVAERVATLEEWKERLIAKMEDDKTAVIQAGEDRASRIHQHIEADRNATDKKINELPERIISILKNTGAI